MKAIAKQMLVLAAGIVSMHSAIGQMVNAVNLNLVIPSEYVTAAKDGSVHIHRTTYTSFSDFKGLTGLGWITESETVLAEVTEGNLTVTWDGDGQKDTFYHPGYNAQEIDATIEAICAAVEKAGKTPPPEILAKFRSDLKSDAALRVKFARAYHVKMGSSPGPWCARADNERIKNPQACISLAADEYTINSLAFDKQGHVRRLKAKDGSTTYWDWDSGRLKAIRRGKNGDRTDYQYAPDGSLGGIRFGNGDTLFYEIKAGLRMSEKYVPAAGNAVPVRPTSVFTYGYDEKSRIANRERTHDGKKHLFSVEYVTDAKFGKGRVDQLHLENGCTETYKPIVDAQDGSYGVDINQTCDDQGTINSGFYSGELLNACTSRDERYKEGAAARYLMQIIARNVREAGDPFAPPSEKPPSGLAQLSFRFDKFGRPIRIGGLGVITQFDKIVYLASSTSTVRFRFETPYLQADFVNGSALATSVTDLRAGLIFSRDAHVSFVDGTGRTTFKARSVSGGDPEIVDSKSERGKLAVLALQRAEEMDAQLDDIIDNLLNATEGSCSY